MRILLDTHVLLWAAAEPERLSRRGLEALESGNEVCLSVVSAWEVVIKAGTGRLRLPSPATDFLRTQAERLQVTLLQMQMTHLKRLQELPPLHADPFDRMIVAQAQAEGMPLLTADRQMHRYAVAVVW